MNPTRTRIAALAAAAAVLLPAACQGRRDRLEPVTVDEIAAHIRYLSSDQLEGRAVGTRGIELAARYHEDYFRTMGLEPAFGTSYRQTFPLKGSRPDPGATLEIAGPGVALAPVLWDEFVVRTEREDIPPEASGELVYAGYLVQAPERQWDDLKGLDVAGKVLLVEINEPGNRPGGLFDGEDMTYYGRWPYKYEKATELGAAGVLIYLTRVQPKKEEITHIRFTNPILDTMLLSDTVHPAHRGHGLQAVAERLGVRIMGRHTAIGDAMATAEVFLRLIPLLAAQGIHTLKEARLASQKSLYARLKY